MDDERKDTCSAVVESSERTENFKSFLLDGNEDVCSCALCAVLSYSLWCTGRKENFSTLSCGFSQAQIEFA